MDSKRLHFILDDGGIDQGPSRNQQPCVRIHIASRQLSQDLVFPVLIHERVAGVWTTAANANIDVFFQRDECGDFAFPFGAKLAANDNP
jgi:hypothetical protein